MPEDALNQTQHVYDLASESYVRVFFDDFSDRPWLDRLIELAPDGARAVDVGSGPGHFAEYLTCHGLPTIATDLSFRMLEAGRRLRGSSVPRCQSDMTRLPFKPQAFDVALVAYSLLHVPRHLVPAALSELRRVCRPASTALLLLKSGQGEETITASLVPNETLYVAYWTEESLAELLVDAGWRIVESESASPAIAKEIQRPKLALYLKAV